MISSIKKHWGAADRELLKGYGALLMGMIFFSTIEVASKSLGTGVPPLLLASLRFIIAGLILLIPSVQLLRLRLEPLSWKDYAVAFGLGAFGVSFSIGVYHMAIPHLQANIAAIAFSANPAFVVLFSPWILHEKLTKRKIAGVMVGLSGILIFAFKDGRLDVGSLRGLFLMTVALVSFAMYTVLSKKVMHRYGAVLLLCLASLIGGILLFPVSWMVEGSPVPCLCSCSWSGILYLSVFGTALGYWLFFFGVINVGATRGSMFFFLKPAMASAFAWMFLGEVVTPRIVTGSLLVIAALICVLMPARKGKS